jgi:hypothetical protein
MIIKTVFKNIEFDLIFDYLGYGCVSYIAFYKLAGLIWQTEPKCQLFCLCSGSSLILE